MARGAAHARLQRIHSELEADIAQKVEASGAMLSNASLLSCQTLRVSDHSEEKIEAKRDAHQEQVEIESEDEENQKKRYPDKVRCLRRSKPLVASLIYISLFLFVVMRWLGRTRSALFVLKPKRL